ncbi:hypothetical protein PENTCL1PPCAC_18265, partial [Pristionchus entomophagus]
LSGTMAEASSVGAPGTSSILHKFHVIEPPANDESFPKPRSGHRTFVDNDFFYVIGGFTDTPTDTILRELWKFNLVTHIWTKCSIPETFPTTLASFACHSNGNGTFMVYGGTAIPFGQELDEVVYMGRIVGDDVQIEQIKPTGSKLGCYGHVLVFDPVRNKTFSVGGTDGTQFKLDVHALHRNETTGKWEWEEYATLVDDVGLYRMEAILENDRIYVFGGGTTQRIQDFKTIQVFNIERKLYELIDTEPDPVHGHPAGRRCHSLVQWGRQVIIAGGCYDEPRRTNVGATVLGCVWSFNLDTHVWRKMDDLPIPCYFHDASITNEGKMFIFGGVRDSSPPNPRGRIASLQTLWLGPPSLFSSALAKMQTMKSVNLEASGHVLSDRLNLCRHIYNEVISPA